MPAGEVLPIDSFSAFRHGVLEVVSGALRHIAVFDTDLQETGLESIAAVRALEEFLSSGPGHTIDIVVHDAAFLERHCPRLLALQKRFSHAAAIRRSPADLRHLAESYVLADDGLGVVRFHKDHVRGKLFRNLPEETAVWRSRFTQLWELSEPVAAPTQLGL